MLAGPMEGGSGFEEHERRRRSNAGTSGGLCPVASAICQAEVRSDRAPHRGARDSTNPRCGCGPGTNAARFDAADYVGVDINGDYLAIARSKYRGRFVQADLARADLAPLGTFDVILVNSFLHHLDDDAVHRVLTELAQLLDPAGKVHILELRPSRRSVHYEDHGKASRNRGRSARPLAAWRDLFEAHFEGQAVGGSTLGRLWAMLLFQGKARR